MNIIFKNTTFDKTIFWAFFLSLIIIIANSVYILVSYNKLPFFLPIYNQMPWGDERLGRKEEILIPILIAISVFIFNFVLSSIIYKKMPIISRIISVTAFLICFFVLIITFRTILLII